MLDAFEHLPVANDRRVIGLAIREATSSLFVKSCDEFIYLDRPGRSRSARGADREKPGARERSERRPRGGGGKAAATGGQVPGWVREVVGSLVAGATGPLNPSFIKGALAMKAGVEALILPNAPAPNVWSLSSMVRVDLISINNGAASCLHRSDPG